MRVNAEQNKSNINKVESFIKKGRMNMILKGNKKIAKYIMAYLAMFSMVLTTLLTNLEVAHAEEIEHTHIWATKYDNTKHWEYCTVCSKTRNSGEHKYTDHWREAKESCWHENYSTRVCECGYSYIYHKPHNVQTEWKNVKSRLLHYKACKDCGTWSASERCRDAEGIISCKNPGTCTLCQAVTTADNHYLDETGNCRDCGMKLVEITQPEIKYASDYSKVTVTFTIIPKANGLTLTGNMYGYTPDKNYKSRTWSSTKNSDGSCTYKLEHIFDERIQRKCEYRCADTSSVLCMNGTPIYMDQRTVRFTVWQDHTAPTVTEVKQKNQAYHNGWATIKELTITGNEDLSDLVTISIIDKQTGDVIVDKATADVKNGKYTYKCTPPLEGPAEGRVYEVVVIDQLEQTTKKDFTIYKTDCRAPLIRSSKEYTEWSQTKNIGLELTDYGAGSPKTSLNDQKSYKDAKKSGDKYIAEYVFGEENYDVSTYTIYLKDGLGNATKDSIKVGRIDNTKPTVVDVKSEVIKQDIIISTTNNPNAVATTAPEVTATSNPTNTVGFARIVVTANDMNHKLNREGSGVSGYALTTKVELPADNIWQEKNEFAIDKAGTYYLWVKDKAGNIADITVLTVNDDMTVTVGKDKIQYNGPENGKDKPVKDDSGKDKEDSKDKDARDKTPKTADNSLVLVAGVVLFISAITMVISRRMKSRRQ